MQTFTERKVEKQENIECIEMYRNVSDKKKWSYTCITRKKMELYMYNSKKNGVIHSYTFLYIPIRSYTFHRSRRFWGKGF